MEVLGLGQVQLQGGVFSRFSSGCHRALKHSIGNLEWVKGWGGLKASAAQVSPGRTIRGSVGVYLAGRPLNHGRKQCWDIVSTNYAGTRGGGGWAFCVWPPPCLESLLLQSCRLLAVHRARTSVLMTLKMGPSHDVTSDYARGLQ